jgi:hypothetical protein
LKNSGMEKPTALVIDSATKSGFGAVTGTLVGSV